MFARNMPKKIKFPLNVSSHIFHTTLQLTETAHMWKPNFLNAKTLWSQGSQLNFKALCFNLKHKGNTEITCSDFLLHFDVKNKTLFSLHWMKTVQNTIKQYCLPVRENQGMIVIMITKCF